MARIYLDHAATTPVNPEVLEEMLPYFSCCYGNPSSLYAEGREANKAVRLARERVAEAINAADPGEIIFTGGGSEGDNMALFGAARRLAGKGRHIVTSAVEHHGVLHPCQALERQGYAVTYLPVDGEGLLRIEDVAAAITDETVLVSVMTANNEVGSIQPVAKIGALARERGALFHTDAVQAVGAIPLDVQALNVDMLTLSAHKFYGPKGVGALYLRKGLGIDPLVYGGAQERGRRGGTENVPGIVGLGAAIQRAVAAMEEESPRLAGLRDALMDGLAARIPRCRLNGPRGERRLPGNVNLSFAGLRGESLLNNLDMAGVAASSGSACTSGALDPSHVLLAMGLPDDLNQGSLRLTLGRGNGEKDVDKVLALLPPIVERLRRGREKTL